MKNAAKILGLLPSPQFTPDLSEENMKVIKAMATKNGRKCFPSQAEYVVLPQYFNLKRTGRGIIAAKMGTGKTTMSNTLAYLLARDAFAEGKGFKTLFLAAGSKFMDKMDREMRAVDPDAVIFKISSTPRRRFNEVSMRDAAEMKPLPGQHLYFIQSKDTNKGSYKITAMKEGSKCPCCGFKLGSNQKKIDPKKDIFRCFNCGDKTFFASGGTRSSGQIYKDVYYKGGRENLFDFLIVDEVHEYQNPESQQAILYRALLNVSSKVIVMTGTLSNGLSSSIFHILFPLIPTHFKDAGFTDNKIGAFVDFFGSKKRSTMTKVDSTGSQRKSTKVTELPRINDRIVSFLAPFTTWFGMDDLNIKMPELTETIRLMNIDEEVSMAFDHWSSEVHEAARGTGHNLFHFNSAKNYRVNNPTHNYVEDIDGSEIFFPSLPRNFRSTKEKELLSIVKKEISEGRRVMIYGVYNQSTNLYGRLVDILQDEGISADFMPDNIKAENIEEWIINFEGDVLVLPQKRVATGLDLVMFHTVIFFEIDQQLRIVQQAKVRPWRPIGQDKDVRIFYLAYRGNQEKALQVMAHKMRSAATVEGEIIEDESIAAIYDYNPEMTEAIAQMSATISDLECEAVKSGGDNRKMSRLEQAFHDMINEDNQAEEVVIETVTETVVEEVVVETVTETVVEEVVVETVTETVVEEVVVETVTETVVEEVVIETVTETVVEEVVEIVTEDNSAKKIKTSIKTSKNGDKKVAIISKVTKNQLSFDF
jgi:hypothetical protein